MHVNKPGGRHAAAEPRLIAPVGSAEPVDTPAAYGEWERKAFAMADGGPREYAPVSVEWVRNCGWGGTDRCASGHQGDGAGTMIDHGTPLVWSRHPFAGTHILAEISREWSADRGPLR